MFGGASEHSLDKKNRMHLPKRILNQIPEEERGSMVISRGFDGCLFFFTDKAWKDYVSKLTGMIPPDVEGRNFLRLLFSSMARVAIDSQGRILLSESMKKIAGIKDKVVVNGMGNYVEIWAADKWAELNAKESSTFEEMYKSFAEKNLGRPG